VGLPLSLCLLAGVLLYLGYRIKRAQKSMKALAVGSSERDTEADESEKHPMEVKSSFSRRLSKGMSSLNVVRSNSSKEVVAAGITTATLEKEEVGAVTKAAESTVQQAPRKSSEIGSSVGIDVTDGPDGETGDGLNGSGQKGANSDDVTANGPAVRRNSSIRRNADRPWRNFAGSETAAEELGKATGLSTRKPSISGVEVDVGDVEISLAKSTSSAALTRSMSLSALPTRTAPEEQSLTKEQSLPVSKPSPKLSAATSVLLRRMSGTADPEDLPPSVLAGAKELDKLQASFRGEAPNGDNPASPTPYAMTTVQPTLMPSNSMPALPPYKEGAAAAPEAASLTPAPPKSPKPMKPPHRKGSAADLIARFNSQEGLDPEKPDWPKPDKPDLLDSKQKPKLLAVGSVFGEVGGFKLATKKKEPEPEPEPTSEPKPEVPKPTPFSEVPLALLRARTANAVKQAAIDWTKAEAARMAEEMEDESDEDYYTDYYTDSAGGTPNGSAPPTPMLDPAAVPEDPDAEANSQFGPPAPAESPIAEPQKKKRKKRGARKKSGVRSAASVEDLGV